MPVKCVLNRYFDDRLFLSLLVLLGVMLCLQVAGGEARELLRYSRPDLDEGQWWRVLSAHLVHSNAMHLFMNATALLLSGVLVGSQLSLGRWAVALLAIALFISLALYVVSPLVAWYVGFSGVLHGLLALGLMHGGLHRDWWFVAAWLLLSFKVGREQLPGFDVNHLQDVIAVAVVVDAHFYGVIAGTCLAVIFKLWGSKSVAPR